MESRALLAKLEPLIPKKVSRWRHTLPMVDPATRELLEKEIQQAARRILGDYEHTALLSLPPERTIKGEFNLGTVHYVRSRWPAGLKRNELLQNLTILGRSGAGKTNAVFHLLEQLSEKNVKWLFLDWKRTARHLIPRLPKIPRIYTPGRDIAPLGFSPFSVPPGLESSVYVSQVVDVLAHAYTLGDGARSILQQAIATAVEQHATPTVHQILSAVDQIPDKERVRGWKISAQRALSTLDFATATNRSTAEHTRSLLTENTIIELDALPHGAKAFLIPLLCLWIYYVQLASTQRERLNFVIIVEEAHHVLHGDTRSRETLMEMLLRQCRELGIGMVVVDQHPSMLSKAALGNTYATICLNLKDPADINRTAGLCQVPDDDKSWLSRLPTGQAVVKLQDRWVRPFVVDVPFVPAPKGVVTDASVRQLAAGDMPRSAWIAALESNGTRVPQIPASDPTLSEEELAFLEDVVTHPENPIRDRYPRLALSVRKGHRIKSGLVRRGWLEESLIDLGRTRKLVLRLTTGASERLGLVGSARNDMGRRYESLPHEYWKHLWARRLAKQGYSVKVEAPRVGGYVDVAAWNAKERVAVEIETGKSDVAKNVKNCLRDGFDRVLVIATDARAIKVVERELARARLLIEERIRLTIGNAIAIR